MNPTKFFRIKNWMKHQHYKGRRPPWIKLHAALFDDYDFLCLQDASKLLAICIWLIASCSTKLHPEGDPILPEDADFITKKAGLKKLADLTPLFSCGFLIRYQDASTTLADCKQSVPLETETETETETDKSCAEPKKFVSTPSVFQLPLAGRKIHNVSQEDVDAYSVAYPGVDIMQQLRSMKEWFLGSPTKMKTERGIKKSIAFWLNGEQNKGGSRGNRQNNRTESNYAAIRDFHSSEKDEQGGILELLTCNSGTFPKSGT